MSFAIIPCLSSLSSSVAGALVVSHKKKEKNMTRKAFEHQLTPNASEYDIFQINWILLKYTDWHNLKVKVKLSVHVQLSQ